jgi:hypothetical protein
MHVFYADSPLGPWTPHPRNPVVSDVRHARPAGRLFRYRGGWYRPAQDCAEGYGRRLAIQRITYLDTRRYAEVPAATLSGHWRPGIAGVHTVNAAGGLTVIDVLLRRWQNPFTRPGATSSAPTEAPDGAPISALGTLSSSTAGHARCL